MSVILNNIGACIQNLIRISFQHTALHWRHKTNDPMRFMYVYRVQYNLAYVINKFNNKFTKKNSRKIWNFYLCAFSSYKV